MKNLKKVLALALAFAMVLSLCISGFAAVDVTTLEDWDKVENQDAVKLLNTFKIMQGDERGNRPNDPVTRAEAAKMLSVALWGGDEDAVKLYANGNAGNFTDLIYDWYKGYINFMAVNGIISGDGNGKFRPDDTVTGYELLKMCLTTLGYDAETAGLTGTGWDLRAMSLATKRTANKNLTDDTNVEDWAKPITRTNAAQVISNMIYRNYVHYDEKGKLVENEDGAKIFGEQMLGMETRVGSLVANEYGVAFGGNITAKEIKAVVADGEANAVIAVSKGPKYAANETDPLNKRFIVTAETGLEDLGMPVVVYFADGVPVSVEVTPYAVIEPEFDAVPPTDVTNFAASFVDTTDVWRIDNQSTDVVGSNNGTDVADFLAIIADSTCEVTCYNKGTGTEGIEIVVARQLAEREVKDVIKTDLGDLYVLDQAAANTKWTSKNSATNVPANTILACQADFTAEKGDHIMVVNTTGTKTNVFGTAFYHGYVMETVEGSVTRKDSNNTKLWLDGVSYDAGNATVGATALGATGTFWMYADGKLASADTTGGTAPDPVFCVVYAAGFETAGSTTAIDGKMNYVVSVKAILPDGTDKVYEVKNVTYMHQALDASNSPSGSPAAKTTAAAALKLVDSANPTAWNTSSQPTDASNVGTWFSNVAATTSPANPLVAFTVTEDGTGINLDLTQTVTSLASNASAKSVATGSAKVELAANKYLTSKSVTFIQTAADNAATGEKWTVYTGLTAPKYNITTSVPTASPVTKAGIQAVTSDLYGTGDGIDYIAFTSTAAALDVPAATTNYYYVLETPTSVLGPNNATVWENVVFNITENKVETLVTGSAATKGNIYAGYNAATFTLGSPVTINATTAGFITNFADNTIRVVTNKSAATVSGNTVTPGTLETAVIAQVSDKTVYAVVNGEDSEVVTAADIAVQADDDAVKGMTTAHCYQAIILDVVDGTGAAGTDGVADMVIVLSAVAAF